MKAHIPTPLICIDLMQVKVAKNTVRYEKFPGDDESNRRATVQMLYVQQTALASAFSKFPRKIRITIEEIQE